MAGYIAPARRHHAGTASRGALGSRERAPLTHAQLCGRRRYDDRSAIRDTASTRSFSAEPSVCVDGVRVTHERRLDKQFLDADAHSASASHHGQPVHQATRDTDRHGIVDRSAARADGERGRHGQNRVRRSALRGSGSAPPCGSASRRRARVGRRCRALAAALSAHRAYRPLSIGSRVRKGPSHASCASTLVNTELPAPHSAERQEATPTKAPDWSTSAPPESPSQTRGSV